MKALTIFLIVLMALAIACSVQVEKEVLEEPLEPVTEMPTEVVESEIVVEPGNGVGVEPVIIEIVAARTITPTTAKVKVGQEVIFVNKHVDGKEDREYIIRGDRFANFESPLLKPGDTWSYNFPEKGDYQYKIMPGAAGRVSVVGHVIRNFFN